MIPEEIVTKCPMAGVDSASDKILIYIKKKLQKKYGDKKPLRGFHAKTIGLVKAQFKIEHSLQEDLKVGLFKDERIYDAWVRFTNGDGTVSPDAAKAVRGMAIKVLGIQSSELLDYESTGKTQDIILFTSRVSIPGPVDKQPVISKLVLGNPFEKLKAVITALPSLSLRSVREFLKGPVKTPNILEEMYYSATPYSFGKNRAIKWHARPLKTITSLMPGEPGDDFLRKRLILDLSQDSKDNISFALLVQFQKNEQTEPIEDPSVDWKTPFHKVAVITIPKQDLDTPERKKEDENMAFSPGHAIPEHAPLGKVNMVRKKVYEELARERLNHP